MIMLFLTCLAIYSSSELVDRGWNFKSLQENRFLSLQTDVLRPSYESAKITLGLDILSYNG